MTLRRKNYGGPGDFSPPGSTTLSDTGVTAGTYGDATNVGQFTVNTQGRITYAADVPIAFPVASGSVRAATKTLAAGDTMTYGDFTPLYVNGGMIDPEDGGGLYLPRNGAYIITLHVILATSAHADTSFVLVELQGGSAANITGANYPRERFYMRGQTETDSFGTDFMEIVRTCTLLTTSVDPDENVSCYPEITWENQGQACSLDVTVRNYQVVELPGADLESGTFI